MTPARRTGWLLVATTAVGWALNWPSVKVLLREWTPLFSRGVAGVAASLLLAAIARVRGESLAVPPAARLRLGLASFTNVFAWMGFSTIAVARLRVGESVLLVYTMPLWAMLLAWPVRGTPPRPRHVLALGLGFAGMLARFGDGASPSGSGVAFALAAAVLFAAGSVALAPPSLPPFARAAWQVGLGSVPMVALGWLLERPAPGAISAGGALALLYMTVVPMCLCYLTWFAALERLPPATAAMGTLLVPILGSVAAAIALGEPLGARELGTAAVTLAGVALAVRDPSAPR